MAWSFKSIPHLRTTLGLYYMPTLFIVKGMPAKFYSGCCDVLEVEIKVYFKIVS